MHLCYLDESGTPDHGGNTQHFVLLGLAFPDYQWKNVIHSVNLIKTRYGIEDVEIHTGWLARRYPAQEGIPHWDKLCRDERRQQSESKWKATLFDVSISKNAKKLQEEKNRFNKCMPYLHLTYEERLKLLAEILDTLGRMSFVRIFAECIDKKSCPEKGPLPIFEQAFLQVVTRFEAYLSAISRGPGGKAYGILIQDNNNTVASRLTKLMTRFHDVGTLYRDIEHIVETPVFVDSRLTSMVQMADACAYAFRRFFDRNETDLFDRIYSRIDRNRSHVVVGARHYVQGAACSCRLCTDHART